MARILVLDDEIEIVTLVTDELRSKGHEIVATTSVQTALDLLRIPSNDFQLILCDVVMPKQNGIDFAKEVNRIPWFRGNLALMSSYTDILDKDIENLGISHVLKKPFTVKGLLSLIEELTLATT